MTGFEIARDYESGNLCGWLEARQPGIAKQQFNLLKGGFVPFRISGQTQATTQKMFLHWIVQKAFGCKTAVPDYYPQLRGDCSLPTTKVLMQGGGTKQLGEVKVGEYVITHQGRAKRVLDTIKKPFSGNLVTLTTPGNQPLTLTPDHRVPKFENKNDGKFRWTQSKDLNVGNGVLTFKDGYYDHAIQNKNVVFVKDTNVYCLHVEDDHSFIANGHVIKNCVSFGMKHGTEIVSAVEIFQNGEREKFRPIHPSYYYGTGRIYVGGWESTEDGSLGSWMATAVMKYGSLFADEPGVPAYSAALAGSWGHRASNGIDKWKPIAINFPVKSMALIKTWDQLVEAITNGYPCTTASNVGYAMEASSDGFHRQNTNWAHQMLFYGVDNGYKNGNDPYALLLNNWDDVHGHLKDFETGEDIPISTLRVRRKDVEKHLRENETFAVSQFVGFPEQKLEKALFKLI